MTDLPAGDRRGRDGRRVDGRPRRRRWVVLTATVAAGLVALPLVAGLVLVAVDALGLLPVTVAGLGAGYAIWRWGRRTG